jgi:tetrathionate reductase subunit B
MKCFVVDVARCNGCYNCQIACKEEHVGNDWTPYARPEPDTGQFWMKMHEKARGTVPKVKVSYVATPCMHCRNAPCMASCGPKAIQRRTDGLVLIDPLKCTGCVNCVDACPYGSIYFNREMNLAQKCTGCAHLLDQGWKEPRCVDVCPTEAIRFGDEEALKSFIENGEVLLPEKGTLPRVYYLNLPKRFIAGSIFDPAQDECLEDVRLMLSAKTTNERPIVAESYCFRGDHGCAPKSNVRIAAATDGFGDFWFREIDTAVYTLVIEKEGYVTRTIEGIDVYGQDVNLGDIGLERVP